MPLRLREPSGQRCCSEHGCDRRNGRRPRTQRRVVEGDRDKRRCIRVTDERQRIIAREEDRPMSMQELGIALRDGEQAAHGGGAYLTERRLDALPPGVAARAHATDV